MSVRTMRFFNRALVAGSAQTASSSWASWWKSSREGAGPESIAAPCCSIRTSISRTCCKARFQRRSSSAATSLFSGSAASYCRCVRSA